MPTTQFIHIQSSKFPILPGEKDELVNDGTYGKALAEFLREQLKNRGYESPFLCCEDWGWWVELTGQPCKLGLCCFGFQQEADSLDLCVRPSEEKGRTWSWTRFRMIDRTVAIEALEAELKSLLDGDP